VTATSRWSSRSYALYPQLDVAGEHGLCAQAAGCSEGRAQAARSGCGKLLDLEPYLDRKPGKLSVASASGWDGARDRRHRRSTDGRAALNLDAKLRVQTRTSSSNCSSGSP